MARRRSRGPKQHKFMNKQKKGSSQIISLKEKEKVGISIRCLLLFYLTDTLPSSYYCKVRGMSLKY